jgi:hypothetical protein
MKYLESINEQKFASRLGARKVFIIEGLGVAVDKQKSDIAIAAMKNALEKRGYNIQITQAGRFGFDKRGGWQFDESMTGQGHPDSWIPGSRGYYAMSAKSIILFPKNEMQFKQDKPENSKYTYMQDMMQALKKKIGILEERKMKSRLEQYLESIGNKNREVPFPPTNNKPIRKYSGGEITPADKGEMASRKKASYHRAIEQIVSIIDDMTATYEEGDFNNETLEQIFSDVRSRIQGY